MPLPLPVFRRMVAEGVVVTIPWIGSLLLGPSLFPLLVVPAVVAEVVGVVLVAVAFAASYPRGRLFWW